MERPCGGIKQYRSSNAANASVSSLRTYFMFTTYWVYNVCFIILIMHSMPTVCSCCSSPGPVVFGHGGWEALFQRRNCLELLQFGLFALFVPSDTERVIPGHPEETPPSHSNRGPAHPFRNRNTTRLPPQPCDQTLVNPNHSRYISQSTHRFQWSWQVVGSLRCYMTPHPRPIQPHRS